ncbi:MAG: NgoFVII family restriction endonuclease [Anaerolineaceae bacterium]|nr:NgoFVII family restriction endonuclease [Anaerolineaceae bacterium]
MPRIFDNIKLPLLPSLKQSIIKAYRADICVGYFNLRGWNELSEDIDRFVGGEEYQARILIGMQKLPRDDVKQLMGRNDESLLDNQTANKLKQRVLRELREQLTIGLPTNAHEIALRKLANQIRAGKVCIKLYLASQLHAKLYLLHRNDEDQPRIAYLGSSNLTFSGLQGQGELNVDVVDQDASEKLAKWFKDRWKNDWCLDISDDIKDIIEDSWAREDLIPPYLIYLKMAYHLSQEARTGLEEFAIPTIFENRLFPYQVAAVKIAAHHLNKRKGVLIGDVVGLGKTIMATALASIFENDFYLETIIICPKNLVEMWQDYVHKYRLHAKVLSISQVQQELPKLPRYRLMIIDESHNLRNREGKRYHAIRDYIDRNDCKVILLTATPYNKTYLDLSNQIRLFLPEEYDIGIRPENLLRDIGEIEFNKRHQAGLTTLAAFEKSDFPDDWRELMRLFLVRRTRSFIKNNYGTLDPENDRVYLTMQDGQRSYFPDRIPKSLKFNIDDQNPDDQYARLYSEKVVDAVNGLNLPRYGLGNYIAGNPEQRPSPAEQKKLDDLGHAGKRLMGFCRTNLFKRLESSGHAFLLSLERHVLRNYVFLYAIENGLPLPLGTQGAELLDARVNDQDEDEQDTMEWFDLGNDSFANEKDSDIDNIADLQDLKIDLNSRAFKERAKAIYLQYQNQYKNRFQWIRSDLFSKQLEKHLQSDADAILDILDFCGQWQSEKDTKLEQLENLLKHTHKNEKVIIFSQFADSVRYLETQLKARGLTKLEGVTGDTQNPTDLAWRFSPRSNKKKDKVSPENELRVLIATDVLSEGQNLQDCAIVVNYDLPWAIIRLIQRAGRVDRIGQMMEEISCYSFLPAEGVDRILHLRDRVRGRLQQNSEVVGSDEFFFEDDDNDQILINLYNEKSGTLDGEDDQDVDLASYAYQIWKNATDANPELTNQIKKMPDVVYSTKGHQPTLIHPDGVLVYMRSALGNDALAWLDTNGNRVSESQYEILQAAACSLQTPALERTENHHILVGKAVDLMLENATLLTGGQLGRPSGARFKCYERLKRYTNQVAGTLWDTQELQSVIMDIYQYPLRETAKDTINRQIKANINDADLAQLAINLRSENMLCIVPDETAQIEEPKVICSLGLREKTE